MDRKVRKGNIFGRLVPAGRGPQRQKVTFWAANPAREEIQSRKVNFLGGRIVKDTLLGGRALQIAVFYGGGRSEMPEKEWNRPENTAFEV